MKKVLVYLFLFFSLNSFSQNLFREAIRNSNLQEIAYQLQLEPGSEQTIETTFIIGKDGTLTQIEAFSEYSELNEEAIKIIKQVGSLKPREVKGEFVEQPISLPIVFIVESLESRAHRLRKAARRKTN